MPDANGNATPEELWGVGPSLTPNQNAPNPIGVPTGYAAKRAGEKVMKGDERLGSHYQDQQVPARYFEGDDWAPASLPPEKVADLQRSLIAAGLIDKRDSIRIGVWDDTSRKGYRSLLSYANASGMSIPEALSNYGMGQQKDATTKRAPLQVRLTDPGELKQAFRKTLVDTLGVGWDESRLDNMVATYQQQERAAQEQDYAQGETGGTITQPPSAASFAQQQAKQQDPAGAQAHDALGYEQQFFGMLKGVA